jgi:hypothetical protein
LLCKNPVYPVCPVKKRHFAKQNIKKYICRFFTGKSFLKMEGDKYPKVYNFECRRLTPFSLKGRGGDGFTRIAISLFF